MRTMIVIDNRLHREAKAYAARQGTTLTQLIEEALRDRLLRAGRPKRKKKVKLTTFRGDGLQPGITLDRMESVYDRMDETE